MEGNGMNQARIEQINAEKAAIARRLQHAEQVAIRHSHAYKAPKGAPLFPFPAWLISLAITSKDGLSYETDLVMLYNDNYIIIPDIKKVCYVESTRQDRKSAPALLAHKQ